MTSKIKNVWIYADAQLSMNAATAVAIDVAKHQKFSLTFLTVFEEADVRILESPVGREMVRLVHEDKKHRIEKHKEDLVVKPCEFVSLVRAE